MSAPEEEWDRVMRRRAVESALTMASVVAAMRPAMAHLYSGERRRALERGLAEAEAVLRRLVPALDFTLPFPDEQAKTAAEAAAELARIQREATS